MKEQDILESYYTKANDSIKEKIRYPKITENVTFMISKISGNKSLISALITSFLKKIVCPKQDIRLHRTDFDNGYSARVLDTKYVSPFFKRYFPKYANKESAFLTLATREKIKWTLQEGHSLKIRDKKLREVFLNILDDIESERQSAKNYLIAFFVALIQLSKEDEKIFLSAKDQNIKIKALNINVVLETLEKHFSNKLSSRLPVIAVYSIYEILMPLLSRYKNKKLVDLETHTSSDKHSFGDIEVYSENKTPFEIVEIKHNIPITEDLIFDIVKKIENTTVNRYYILTTYKSGFEDHKTEKEINKFILQIKAKKNIDIIANGILATIKYYLRFIDSYQLFLKTYTKNLVKDAKYSTEIKNYHIENWITILKSKI